MTALTAVEVPSTVDVPDGIYPSGSALAALHSPITHRVRLPKSELDELNIIRRELDVDALVLDLVKYKRFSLDVRASVTAADVELSIDGAHELVITVRDAHRKLQQSGALDYAIDINIEGWWWRLQKREKEGDNLTLTFEPRVVSYLREHNKARKASRGKVTRAEFILLLIRAVKKTRIKFYCPELHKKQKIGKVPERDERQRADNREPGLDEDFFIKIDGSRASETVMKNLERVLTVGDNGVDVILPPSIKRSKVRARRKVQVATVMCILQESRGETSATNGVHVGLFQQNPKYWPGTRDPEKDGEAWYRAVITADHGNARLPLTALIEKVQGSGKPEAYAQWRDEAEDVVAHFSDSNGPRAQQVREKYEFKTEKDENTGKRENYWGTIIRLAEEVVWRAFTIKDRLIYMSEEDLFKSKSLMTLSEGQEGVDYINYKDDDRKDITEVTVICRMSMWDAPLGSVVTIKNDCSADGRYLVVGLRRSYFSLNGEIRLRKPQVSKPEPPPKVHTARSDEDSKDVTGDAKKVRGGDLTYPLSKHGKAGGGVAEHHSRAWGDWQSDNAIDILVGRGTTVYAVANGRIAKLGGRWNGGSGNPDGWNVTLETDHGWWFYTHLMERVNLKVGQVVRAGDELGKSGAANGVDHLHIACRPQDGDPQELLRV
jgi:murein DD-endopeptidase MepM/ murein hydrolase activator NlpD